MNFVFLSTRTFESWDWTNPDKVGIGGSETSHIEMAQRLQKLGHNVTSFAPLPKELACDGNYAIDPAGVVWYAIEDFPAWQDQIERTEDAQAQFVYIVYRAPELIDFLPPGAIVWLICQDVDYQSKGRTITPERAAKLTRLVPLCGPHADYFKARYPGAPVTQSSNGIKRALIEEIALDPPAREPHRLMYASSPDRGMEYLLEIFPRLRDYYPDLELHIYYGFDNIDKVVAWFGERSKVAMNTERLRKSLAQPGVIFHGRLGQPELLREWFKASLWVHPSNFTETSCITCMDAQACGAIPVTSPVWAIAENVQFGTFIEGDVRNQVIQGRYVKNVLELLAQPDLQQEIREEMMPWARDAFDWDIFAHQWQGWARADTGTTNSDSHGAAVSQADDETAMIVPPETGAGRNAPLHNLEAVLL